MANFLMIDTETMNATPDDRNNLLVYDVGFAVIDQKGKVMEKHSYIIKECFFEMKNIMREAYYANKIPLYYDGIEDGTREVVDFLDVYYKIQKVVKKYEVVAAVAHNMGFDYAALNATLRYLTKSEKRWFFPYGLPLYDTLKMARQVWGKSDKYKRWCAANGYLTNHSTPQVRLTAEILFRYITKQFDFVEAHTGLEDVMIEKYIFVACYNSRKCKDKELWGRSNSSPSLCLQ